MEVRQNGEVSNFIIVYEFILGLVELILGLGIAFLGSRVENLTDLVSDQHDLIADFLQNIIPYILTHKFYIVVLLIALGLVKIISSIGLWMKKEWGRHLLIWLLIVLIPFNMVGLFRHPTILDGVYLMIDILIILYMTGFKPKEYFQEVGKLFK